MSNKGHFIHFLGKKIQYYNVLESKNNDFMIFRKV